MFQQFAVGNLVNIDCLRNLRSVGLEQHLEIHLDERHVVERTMTLS